MGTTSGSAGERRFLMYEYLIKNTCEGRVAKQSDIANHLLRYNIRVNIKTFYKDIAALETEAYGIRIQYDQKKNGYWVMNPPFSKDELRWIIDSIQASRFLTQKKADEITDKIRDLAGEEDRLALRRPAFVAGRVRNMNESIVEESAVLYQAIAGNRKISFRYFHRQPNRKEPKRYSNKGNSLVVSPFALLWEDGKYYLYAYESEEKRFKTYRVDRMDTIRLDELGRDGVDAYNKKNITDRQAVVFDMYHGDIHRVNLQCHNTIMDAVLDRFGSKALISPIDDNHFTASATVELSPPFFAWVAIFGHKIKILSPTEAVDKMKEFLQKACDMYEENGEK